MVSNKKILNLKKISELLKGYSSIILFDLKNLPSKQLHEIRDKLKSMEIYTLVSKKKILKLALKENKIDLNVDNFKQPAIIYSNKGIFEITKNLKKLKVNGKVKVGEIIDSKIEIPAMNTEIQAGPAISIFKHFQIQTTIKEGKIIIREPKIICEKGKEINPELVSLLNMLHIEPVEITINPELGYSNKLVYNKDVLGLDEKYLREQIFVIANNLLKLTFNMGYLTKQNSSLLLQKSSQTARNLGLRLGLPLKELLPDLIKKVQIETEYLNSKLTKNA